MAKKISFIEEENDNLREQNECLIERVLALKEIMDLIISDRKIVNKEVSTLLLSDYIAYLQLAEYCTVNNKTSITSHCIARKIWMESDSQHVENTLLNLERLGFISLSLGKKFVIVETINPTVFHLQKIKNKKEGLVSKER